MIGSGQMEIKRIEIEIISGKELRQRTATAKDNEKYLVWIQRMDHNITSCVPPFDKVECGFKKKA